MADSDADDEAEFAPLDVAEASARLSNDELCDAVAKALVFRAVFRPDMRPPHFEDRFEVRDVLGKGGYGCVFLVWDTALEREVAIKLCKVDPLLDDAFLLAEARALAKLNHANIVTVHECVRTADKLLMVMEFVGGGTLISYIPRSWPEFVKVSADVARAVAYAHSEGVIHGDIKPENILIGDDLRPRIADFGMARIVGAPVLMPDAIGTVPFASPERLAGQGPPDAYSDQWAFIATLYERIGGKLPGLEAHGEIPSTERRMLRALEVWAGPRLMGDDVPRGLVEIIKTGLAFEREDRFPDMNAVADALDQVFVSGLIPGAVVDEGSEPEGVALQPREPRESGGTKKTIKGVGIGVAFSLAVGGVGAQIYAVKHRGQDRAVESSETQRALTPAERGEQKIRAASEFATSIPSLQREELALLLEVWRQGADLLRSTHPVTAADLTLELASSIAMHEATAEPEDLEDVARMSALLTVKAAQWYAEDMRWEHAVHAQTRAVQHYETAHAPEQTWARRCLNRLRAQRQCQPNG